MKWPLCRCLVSNESRKIEELRVYFWREGLSPLETAGKETSGNRFSMATQSGKSPEGGFQRLFTGAFAETSYESHCVTPLKFFQECVDSPCQHDKFRPRITEAALCGGTRVANSVMLV